MCVFDSSLGDGDGRGGWPRPCGRVPLRASPIRGPAGGETGARLDLLCAVRVCRISSCVHAFVPRGVACVTMRRDARRTRVERVPFPSSHDESVADARAGVCCVFVCARSAVRAAGMWRARSDERASKFDFSSARAARTHAHETIIITCLVMMPAHTMRLPKNQSLTQELRQNSCARTAEETYKITGRYR